jgi:hypothetical protein
VLGLLVGEQLQRVGERRAENREAVAAAAGRSGEIHDERRAGDAGDATGEEAVRRLRDRVGADCLRDAGRLPVEHLARGLGRDVARREPRAARRQDEPRARDELAQRGDDPVVLVRHHTPLDLVALAAEQLLEQVAARVVRRAARDAVGRREHRSSQTGSFVFSSRRTSATTISLSTAFAMS